MKAMGLYLANAVEPLRGLMPRLFAKMAVLGFAHLLNLRAMKQVELAAATMAFMSGVVPSATEDSRQHMVHLEVVPKPHARI